MRQKGFTVLELIIAIAIMGSVALIGVPSLAGVQTRSELKSDKLTGAQIGQAMLIKNLEDGNGNSYLNQQVKYEDISNIDVYISNGYKPLVMQDGYYVISQVEVEGRTGSVLMIGISKDSQTIEAKSIYDGKAPGWVWCQAGEIEKFLTNNNIIPPGPGVEVEPVVTYVITATSTVNGGIAPSGAYEVTSGKNAIFVSESKIDEETVAYFFDCWEIDGVKTEDVGADNMYTFMNVQENHTIKAVYVSEDKYQLTVELNNILEMNTNILPGESITVGSNASGYNVSGIESQDTGTFTFTMPNNSVTIKGTYGENVADSGDSD